MKKITQSKYFRYSCATLLILFYAYIALKSGIPAAIAIFFKLFAIVLFGMAHIWVVDFTQFLVSSSRRFKCFSTSLQERFQRSQ